MSFLAEVIPGLREFRSPLIGGYTWLVAVAIATGGSPDLTGNPLGDLIDSAGPVVTGAAVSVVAFFLGSMSEDVYTPLLRLRRGASLTSLAVQAGHHAENEASTRSREIKSSDQRGE